MLRLLSMFSLLVVAMFQATPATARDVIPTSSQYWWLMETEEGCYVYWYQHAESRADAIGKSHRFYRKVSWSGDCPKGKLANGQGTYFTLYDLDKNTVDSHGVSPMRITCTMVDGLLEGSCKIEAEDYGKPVNDIVKYHRGCSVRDTYCNQKPAPPVELVETSGD